MADPINIGTVQTLSGPNNTSVQLLVTPQGQYLSKAQVTQQKAFVDQQIAQLTAKSTALAAALAQMTG